MFFKNASMSLKLFKISFYLYIFVCVSICIKIWMQRNQKDHEQEKKKVSLTKYNQSDIAKPFNDKSVNQNWSTADFWEEG